MSVHGEYLGLIYGQETDAQRVIFLVASRTVSNSFFIVCYLGSRYPDEEAGQIPMAFVVRKPGSNITEAQVIDFISKLVSFWIPMETMKWSTPLSPDLTCRYQCLFSVQFLIFGKSYLLKCWPTKNWYFASVVFHNA